MHCNNVNNNNNNHSVVLPLSDSLSEGKENKGKTLQSGGNIHEEFNTLQYLHEYVSTCSPLQKRLLGGCSLEQNAASVSEEGNGPDLLANKMAVQQAAEARLVVDDLLKKLYRNMRLQEVSDSLEVENEALVNDYHQKVNDLLLAVDALRRDINGNNNNEATNINLSNNNYSEKGNSIAKFRKVLEIAEVWPINLSYKRGMDAFKEFLDDSPGARNLLLWSEVSSGFLCVGGHSDIYQYSQLISGLFCNFPTNLHYYILKSLIHLL